jgi:hypothetical protein
VQRLVARWCEAARSVARIEWHWGRVRPEPGEAEAVGITTAGRAAEA